MTQNPTCIQLVLTTVSVLPIPSSSNTQPQLDQLRTFPYPVKGHSDLLFRPPAGRVNWGRERRGRLICSQRISARTCTTPPPVVLRASCFPGIIHNVFQKFPTEAFLSFMGNQAGSMTPNPRSVSLFLWDCRDLYPVTRFLKTTFLCRIGMWWSACKAQQALQVYPGMQAEGHKHWRRRTQDF